MPLMVETELGQRGAMIGVAEALDRRVIGEDGVVIEPDQIG
jgi:hypothetical protein